MPFVLSLSLMKFGTKVGMLLFADGKLMSYLESSRNKVRFEINGFL